MNVFVGRQIKAAEEVIES